MTTKGVSEKTGIPVWRIQYVMKVKGWTPVRVGRSLIWEDLDVRELVRLDREVPRVPERGVRYE